MSVPPAGSHVRDFFGTPLAIGPSPGQLSGGAGPVPVRQFDERLGFTRSFAGTLATGCPISTVRPYGLRFFTV